MIEITQRDAARDGMACIIDRWDGEERQTGRDEEHDQRTALADSLIDYLVSTGWHNDDPIGEKAISEHIDEILEGVEYEDPPLPGDYDPGNDLGTVGTVIGNYTHDAFIRIQQYIVDLQQQLLAKTKNRGDRVCDARDLNYLAEHIYSGSVEGENEAPKAALARIGRDLCGTPLADGANCPPVWEA